MLEVQIQSAWKALVRAFSTVPKPSKTRGCNCSSCLPEDRILALLGIDPEQIAPTDEVRIYVANALGTIGTAEDLTFLFPGLARIWAEMLWESDSNDAYRERFWEMLNRDDFVDAGLPTDLRTAVTTFLRTALVARIGSEGPLRQIKGVESAHLWMEDLSGFATVINDLSGLWGDWWAIPSPGHAVAAVQFASCVVFEPANNPIFDKWTPLRGGGPPSLFQRPGGWWIYWTEANVAFIRRTLTPSFLESALALASERLQDPAEKAVADSVLAGVRGDPAGVTARIAALTEH